MPRRIVLLSLMATLLVAQTPKGWEKGKGYGWVYGSGDEVGALNAITAPAQVLEALQGVKTGKVYDLGVLLDKRSYKWPGHSPIEVVTYRSPAGEQRLGDAPSPTIGWHSCALFISDNVGTQIDGLGHITDGKDTHWYNGFTEEQYGGDFGVLKADADTIPPIIARAVFIDVAGYKGVEALESNYPITPEDLKGALKKQGVDVTPGNVVLIRTGSGRYWGETGSDHAKIGEHDSAGITLDSAKWLIEEKGAVLIGSDTSGLEVGTDPARPNVPLPVHRYMLIEQGVHIGELHALEDLARDRVYEFTYIAVTNRIKGTTAGFAMRPLAIR